MRVSERLVTRPKNNDQNSKDEELIKTNIRKKESYGLSLQSIKLIEKERKELYTTEKFYNEFDVSLTSYQREEQLNILFKKNL